MPPEDENNKFVRRGECERIMGSLEKRLDGVERNMEKLAGGVSENNIKMTKLEAHFNDRLNSEVAKRQSWGNYKTLFVVTAVNVFVTILIRVLFP